VLKFDYLSDEIDNAPDCKDDYNICVGKIILSYKLGFTHLFY